jgi:hypothetical protein
VRRLRRTREGGCRLKSLGLEPTRPRRRGAGARVSQQVWRSKRPSRSLSRLQASGRPMLARNLRTGHPDRSTPGVGSHLRSMSGGGDIGGHHGIAPDPFDPRAPRRLLGDIRGSAREGAHAPRVTNQGCSDFAANATGRADDKCGSLAGHRDPPFTRRPSGRGSEDRRPQGLRKLGKLAHLLNIFAGTADVGFIGRCGSCLSTVAMETLT